MGWEQLDGGIRLPFHPDLEIPDLTEIALDVPDPPPVEDLETETHRRVIDRLGPAITAGMTIAVGAGSRGLSGRNELLRGTISGLRSCGAEVFVVPAMGSHGGGTAEGQRAVLATLGTTEEAIGAEIRSTMETVEVARTAAGMPIHLDRYAAAADAIVPVNRIKPHTCFTGPVESGCTKMAVVGFGKQPGAAQIHSCGPVEMRTRLLDGIDALRSTGRLLGGVASLESARGEVVRVEALTGPEIGGGVERDLTDQARSLLPRLPIDEIDVLVVERAGKEISGTMMDPNVTGRFWVPGLADLDRPRVTTIVLLSLTEKTAGNALGIGFADFVPADLAASIDWEATYLNCFTAGPSGLRRSRMPMVLADEDTCVRAALSMCGRGVDEPKRVVRIESTLHLTRCWVSDPVLAEMST